MVAVLQRSGDDSLATRVGPWANPEFLGAVANLTVGDPEQIRCSSHISVTSLQCLKDEIFFEAKKALSQIASSNR